MQPSNVELSPEAAKSLLYKLLLLWMDSGNFQKHLRTVYQKQKYPQHVIQVFDQAYREVLQELREKGQLPAEKIISR